MTNMTNMMMITEPTWPGDSGDSDITVSVSVETYLSQAI